MDGELQSKMQESNQQVKTLHENIAALKEMHREELEELKREVAKQVFITQAHNVCKRLHMSFSLYYALTACLECYLITEELNS